MPGRGAYICRTEECVSAAEKSKRLNGALKAEVPDSVYGEIRKFINDEQ